MPRRLPRKRNETVLAPVRPNSGLEAWYRGKLTDLLDQLHKSVSYWVLAAYRANPPEVAALAADGVSFREMRDAIRKLAKRWLKRFDDLAEDLAKHFATKVSERSDAALKASLKRGGFAIEWKMTAAQRDIVGASVAENVALIKSIPAQYLTQVEGSVMRSIQTGRDLHQLSTDLQQNFQVSRRRAVFIARDQSNKVNAALTRARQLEIGITEAIWLHSAGGRKPRTSHVKAGQQRQRYDVSKGWYDPHEKKLIWPGQLINCRCVCRPVISGFTKA